MEQRRETDGPAQEINPYEHTIGQRKATEVRRRSQQI